MIQSGDDPPPPRGLTLLVCFQFIFDVCVFFLVECMGFGAYLYMFEYKCIAKVPKKIYVLPICWLNG